MPALVLALCLHTGFAEDHRNGNNAGLAMLGVWAATNIVVGGAGWLVTDDPVWKGAHQANLVWGLVNMGFAVVGLYLGMRPEAQRTGIADAKGTQFTYAINAAFDVGYLALSAMLFKLVESMRWKGVFGASMVQALWLLGFDAGMALFHQLNNERVHL